MKDLNSDQTITGVSKSNRSIVYLSIAGLAILGLAGVVVGSLSIILYLGLLFSLAFVALFLTSLKYFIIVLIASRTLMEAFLEPTRIPLGGSSIQLVGFLGVMILLGGLIFLFINRIKVYEMSVVLPMMVFLATSFPAMLMLSSDLVTGIKDWIGTASALMLFVLVVSLFQNKKDIILLLGAFIASTFIPLAVAYYQLFTGTGNQATAGLNRIFGTFVHPNSLAAYLVVMLLLCIPLMLESKVPWQQIGFGVLNLLMALALIFTYARASWFGLLIGLIIISIVRYRKLLLFMPVVLVLVIILVPSVTERMQEILSFSEGSDTGGSMLFRLEMTRFLLPKFYDSPIVGNGLGSFGVFAQEGMGYYYLPHNDYVRVLVDTGLVGMACYLMFWFSLARGAIRSYIRQNDEMMKVLSLVLLALVADFLLTSISENLFRMVILQTYMWTLAGVVAAAARSIPVSAEPRKILKQRPEEKGSFEQLKLSDAQV